MNDFLDRVTAKAIGNTSMLTPRLPSLFEPQAASIMPATFETNAIEEQRNPQAAPDVAEAAHREPGIERSPSSMEAQPNEATHKQAPSQPDATQRSASRVATQSSIETTMLSSDVAAENVVQPTATDRPSRHATPREPVVPRMARVSAEPQAPAIARPPETGVLLPPARPVFVSTKNLGDLPARAAEAMYSRSASAAMLRAEQSETVVHVSIGRLEVRAAPNNATTPPRRSDAPRPSTLDDYLRQRGKAVP